MHGYFGGQKGFTIVLSHLTLLWGARVVTDSPSLCKSEWETLQEKAAYRRDKIIQIPKPIGTWCETWSFVKKGYVEKRSWLRAGRHADCFKPTCPYIKNRGSSSDEAMQVTGPKRSRTCSPHPASPGQTFISWRSLSFFKKRKKASPFWHDKSQDILQNYKMHLIKQYRLVACQISGVTGSYGCPMV